MSAIYELFLSTNINLDSRTINVWCKTYRNDFLIYIIVHKCEYMLIFKSKIRQYNTIRYIIHNIFYIYTW